MKKRILITGGAGFIGSHLIKKLNEEGGWDICVLDTLNEKIHPKGWHIPDDVLLFNVDIRDNEMVALALEGVTHVVHLASETGVGQSAYEMPLYIDVNEYGTAVLMAEIAKLQHSIQSLVLASSRAVYGNGCYFCESCGDVYPVKRLFDNNSVNKWDLVCPTCGKSSEYLASSENHHLLPTSIYAITKQNQEQIVRLTAQSCAIPSTILRLQNVYGQGQTLANPYTGILSLFSNRIMNNNPLFVYEDGQALRDFIYIADVVDAIMLALNQQNIDCETFNVGTGIGTSIADVAHLLCKKFNKQTPVIINGQCRFGDIRHAIANPLQAQKGLGFEAKYTLDKGLDLFVEWMEHQPPQLDSYGCMMGEMKEQSEIDKH